MSGNPDAAGNPPPTAKRPTERWQQIAWIGAIVFLSITMVLLLGTVGYSSYRSMGVISSFANPELGRAPDPMFLFAGLSLINTSLVKTIAILSGTAISFAGIAISFFSHEKANQLVASNGDTTGSMAKVALTAYSPGIFGVVVGAAVIMTTVLTPNKYSYSPPVTNQLTYQGNAAAQREVVPTNSNRAAQMGMVAPDEVDSEGDNSGRSPNDE
ncbi:hypothetical protein [Pseudomonas solani]|uniref:hypothetical protein n=1 Tax=Pseudomonas solani TaxID=2731552 RepID=UPI003D6A72F5